MNPIRVVALAAITIFVVAFTAIGLQVTPVQAVDQPAQVPPTYKGGCNGQVDFEVTRYLDPGNYHPNKVDVKNHGSATCPADFLVYDTYGVPALTPGGPGQDLIRKLHATIAPGQKVTMIVPPFPAGRCYQLDVVIGLTSEPLNPLFYSPQYGTEKLAYFIDNLGRGGGWNIGNLPCKEETPTPTPSPTPTKPPPPTPTPFTPPIITTPSPSPTATPTAVSPTATPSTKASPTAPATASPTATPTVVPTKVPPTNVPGVTPTPQAPNAGNFMGGAMPDLTKTNNLLVVISGLLVLVIGLQALSLVRSRKE